MPIRVLVVDDSSFFRRRIADILNASPELKVVAVASNGQEALDKLAEAKPDVITMDYEMPLMDGITAVRHIMRDRPTPILMFSSLTYEGARVTLDALDAGALDFLPKNFESVSKDSALANKVLRDRVIALVKKKDSDSNLKEETGAASLLQNEASHSKSSFSTPLSKPAAEPSLRENKSREQRAPISKPVSETAPRSSDTVTRSTPRTSSSHKKFTRPGIVAIGASTGGPVALQAVLKELPVTFPLPVLVTQHMPSAFTQAFAERLNKVCKIHIKEALDKEPVRPGHVYVAPGGKQMMISGTAQNPVIRILEGDDRLRYRPSVDLTFGSVAKIYQGKALAIVLTGMGADGREGGRLLKQYNSQVWVQDEASCVVYGMPMAVKQAGLADAQLELANIGKKIVSEVLG